MAELTESGHAFLGKAAEGVAAARLRQQQRSAARKVIPRNAAGVDLRLGRYDIYRWGQRGKDWFPNQEELFAKVPIDPDVFFVAVDRPNYVDWTAELQHLVIDLDKPIVKGYLHFASPEEFFAKADSLSLRYPLCAYEMIPEGTPVRGFFDLEVEPASAWAGDELAMCQSVLDLLNAVAGPLGHPKVALSDCTVSCASVPAKRSCHLVVLNAWWPCISDLRRVVAVMLDRADALRYERPKEDGSVASFCLLDRTTGHKQLYRTAGSYKGKHDVASDMIVATRRLEPVQLPGMVALELRGREDYLATGMGHDWLDAHHRMKLDTELAASLLPRPMRGGQLRPHGMTAEATSALEARIQAWCIEHEISVPIIPGTCNDDGSWQCGVAAVCAIAGRRHKSNRARCRTTGAAVEWGCYDEECRKRGWRPLFSLVQFASADEEEETAAPVAGEEDDSGAAETAAPVAVEEDDSDSDSAPEPEKATPPSYESATEDATHLARKAELAAIKEREKQLKKEEREQKKKADKANKPSKAKSAKELAQAYDSAVFEFDSQFNTKAMQDALQLPELKLMQWWQLVVGGLDDNHMRRLMDKKVVPFLNLFWCKVRWESKVFIKTPVAATAFQWKGMTDGQFQAGGYSSFHFKFLRWSDKVPHTPVSKYWFNSALQHLKEEAEMVSPWARKEDQCLSSSFNTFSTLLRPHGRAKENGDSGSQDARDFKDYFYNGFLSEEKDMAVKDYAWKWFCSQYQRPGYRLKRALLFYSEKRQVGKTYMCEFVRDRLLGVHLVSVCRQNALFDRFNSFSEGQLLVSVDEFKYERAQVEAIRNFITNGILQLERKGENIASRRSTCNAAFTANSATCFKPEEWQQRGLLMKVGLGILHPQWVHLKDRDWNADDVGKMMLEEDLRSWNPEQLPSRSAGLQVQTVEGEEKFKPVANWIRAVLSTVRGDAIEFGMWTPTELLWEDFVGYREGNERLVNRNTFVKLLKRDFHAELQTDDSKGVAAFSAARQRWAQESEVKRLPGVLLPQYSECRRLFEQHTSTTLEVRVGRSEQGIYTPPADDTTGKEERQA